MPLPNENLLGRQTSPYLQQHRDNPVHWRPWSAEALKEAESLNKPILLSIGYAACHWCHVMAHECFEDPDVAEVMNDLFVNIKVDREERPDIDQIYMTALTATGEQGGWPLTMFLTPQAKPFWGGTYFPKKARFGRPGFVEVLKAVHTAWEQKQHDLERSAVALAQHVHERLSPSLEKSSGAAPPLAAFAGKIAGMMDPELGGLQGAPKFPNAPFLDLLWLDWLENRTSAHRDSVLRTLRFMLSGGIYDHVGGGLSRYAVDTKWLVPHFEKMLYDNAQLIRLAGLAYSETGDELFRVRIEETIGWLLREMRVEGGGFASSLDADSEGEEGKFYLWTKEEITKVIGAEADELFSTYSLSQPDAWEGDPILHRLEHPDLGPPEREAHLQHLLARLRQSREQRVHPGRDDKVLVDWNGLAIAAIASAGRQFDRPDWIEAAHDAFRFVCESMQDDRLPHSLRSGRSLFPALSSDYAAMISAALALHGAYQQRIFLDQAIVWADTLDRWYADEHGSGYYLTASDSEDLPMRIRGDLDEAVPSASAQIIIALTHLATVTGDQRRYDHAVKVAEVALERAAQQPFGQIGIVYAASLAKTPMKLLINEAPESNSLVSVANQVPDPRRVDFVLPETETALERQSNIKIDRSITGAWMCVGQTCFPPFHTPDDLREALRNPKNQG